jgi:exonuclease III
VYLNYRSEPHRLRQVGNLFSAMDRRDGGRSLPAVLAGDCNALTFEDYTPEQFEEMASVKSENGREAPSNELTTFMKEQGYMDCWQMSPSKSGPLSTCRYGTRIDYIWASASFVQRFVPTHTETVDMIEEKLTDHNMVVCAFVAEHGD